MGYHYGESKAGQEPEILPRTAQELEELCQRGRRYPESRFSRRAECLGQVELSGCFPFS